MIKNLYEVKPMDARQLRWRKQDNKITRKQLRESVDRYSRRPFGDVLTQLLQCRPTPDAILEWAMQHPDKWANACSIMAKLSGYADQQEINLNITDTTQLSDAQLLQRLLELRTRLEQQQQAQKKSPGLLQGPVVDVVTDDAIEQE